MLGYPDPAALSAAGTGSLYSGPEQRQRWQAMMERSGVARHFEGTLCKRDGTPIWVRGNARVVRDSAGQVVCYEGALEDITERRQAEEERKRLYEQARRDAQTKTELLQEINHRVKNNLLAIWGLLLTEQRYASEKARPFVKVSLGRVADRIRGLLEAHTLLSAAEWGPVRLSELAAQVIRAALQAAPPDKQVTVDVPPAPVTVSPRQASSLALVINELATNTLRHALHARDTVRITLRVSTQADTIGVEYRDDGPGYPAEVIALQRYNVGIYLVQRLTTETLRGQLTLANDNGAVTRMRIKMEEMERT
jgi:two-component sensor histidine kinase